MSRMILLGVGTAVPDVDRENTHMVWDGPGGPLLIDTGGSTYQRLLRAGIEPRDLQGVLITHTHADHINSLPVLLFSLHLVTRTAPLPIYGTAETLQMLERLIVAFNLEEIQAPIEWRPLTPGDTLPLSQDEQNEGDWIMRTALTQHFRPALALRFEERTSGQALVYSADTAPCAAVQALAQGAHTLIHEATSSQPSEYHTTPHEAGTVAQQAGVKRLVLVHFSPRWTMPEAEALAEVQASGFEGAAEVGKEQQVITLPRQANDS